MINIFKRVADLFPSPAKNEGSQVKPKEGMVNPYINESNIEVLQTALDNLRSKLDSDRDEAKKRKEWASIDQNTLDHINYIESRLRKMVVDLSPQKIETQTVETQTNIILEENSNIEGSLEDRATYKRYVIDFTNLINKLSKSESDYYRKLPSPSQNQTKHIEERKMLSDLYLRHIQRNVVNIFEGFSYSERIELIEGYHEEFRIKTQELSRMVNLANLEAALMNSKIETEPTDIQDQTIIQTNSGEIEIVLAELVEIPTTVEVKSKRLPIHAQAFDENGEPNQNPDRNYIMGGSRFAEGLNNPKVKSALTIIGTFGSLPFIWYGADSFLAALKEPKFVNKPATPTVEVATAPTNPLKEPSVKLAPGVPSAPFIPNAPIIINPNKPNNPKPEDSIQQRPNVTDYVIRLAAIAKQTGNNESVNPTYNPELNKKSKTVNKNVAQPQFNPNLNPNSQRIEVTTQEQPQIIPSNSIPDSDRFPYSVNKNPNLDSIEQSNNSGQVEVQTPEAQPAQSSINANEVIDFNNPNVLSGIPYVGESSNSNETNPQQESQNIVPAPIITPEHQAAIDQQTKIDNAAPRTTNNSNSSGIKPTTNPISPKMPPVPSSHNHSNSTKTPEKLNSTDLKPTPSTTKTPEQINNTEIKFPSSKTRFEMRDGKLFVIYS